MANREHITYERLVELLDYDPETGVLRWKQNLRNGIQSGTVAGNYSFEGYIEVKVDGRKYRAHRLIILYMTKEIMEDHVLVDHINGIKDDNRYSNLRKANRKQNMANSKVSKRNKVGVKGVYREKSGRYSATIKWEGKNLRLGTYSTLEEAAKMYRIKAKELHGEFTSDGKAL